AFAALVLGAPLALAQQVQPPVSAPPASPAAVVAGDWVYSVSLQGTPHYQPGFARFDYVNPNAPKGGTFKMTSTDPTFDTVNPILSKGVPADGLGLVYQTLMTDSLDETDINARYPEVADKLKFPADYSSVTYHIDQKARWQD